MTPEDIVHESLDRVETAIEQNDYETAAPIMREAIINIGGIADPVSRVNATNRQVRVAERLTDVWMNS